MDYIIVDSTIHSITTFIFLTIFFYVYVSKVAVGSFQNSIKNTINNNINNYTNSLNIDDKILLNSMYDWDKLIAYYNQPSNDVTQNNQWIQIAIITIIVVLSLILILTLSVLYFKCNYTLPLKEILIENGIILVFICIIEYIFFTNIAVKYTIASGNELNNEIVSTIDKNLV